MSSITLYRIVSKSRDGKLSAVETTDLSGYTITGYHDNPRTRQELQGQPKLEGYLGPMYDGNAIRYESQAAYDTLSK